MKNLLYLKHWQIFLLSYGLLFSMYIVMIFGFLFGMGRQGGTIGLITLMIISSIVSMVVLYGWFWTVGNELFPKLPEGVNMNLKMFRTAVIFPIGFILFLGVRKKISYAR